MPTIDVVASADLIDTAVLSGGASKETDLSDPNKPQPVDLAPRAQYLLVGSSNKCTFTVT